MSQVRVFTLALFVALVCLATTFQTSKAKDSDDWKDSPEDWIDAHNAVRAKAGLGPLVWDENYAWFAGILLDFLAEKCDTRSSSHPGDNVGKTRNPSAKNVIEMWVKDWASYDNLVYHNWVKVGCAKVLCSDGVTYIVKCLYSEVEVSKDINVM